MNPEVRKLRERTRKYKEKHPEYKHGVKSHNLKRKNWNTRKRLKPGTRCTYCGKLLSAYTATIDHIIPLSRGGEHEPWNLCWCCRACNQAKGHKTREEWKCT